MDHTNSQSKVNWTSRERRELTLKIIELEETAPNLTFAALISRAQNVVLPPERRRNIATRAVIPWMHHEREAAMADLRARQEAEQRKKVQQAAASLTESLSIEMFIKSLPQSFVDRLADSIADRVVAKITQKVRYEGLSVSAGVPEAGLPAKRKLPKVLVMGTLPMQNQELSREFEGLFNVRYWKDEGPKTLRDLASSSDVIVVMTGKVSHPPQEVATRCAKQGCKILMANGGVSSIKDQLEKYYIETA